jgi:hypothetical protein
VTDTFDDPNREAVGLPPIWADAGTAPAAKSEPEPKPKASTKKPAKDAGDD